MSPRRVIVAVVAALAIMSGPLGAAAFDTSRRGESGAFGADNHWPRAGHWSKSKERRNSYWAFYADLSYYADPEYFLRCYRRTRIETLYWVSWRPVRACN